MALAYLIDPEIQFSNKSGMLNVAGFLRVYLNGTDDRAVTYKDFNGTLNEADIILDNNGRAVVVADSSKAYRLEVYNREGALLWTTYPLETLKGGGGGTAGFNVVSSDGTVEVNRYSSGGVTNFDLSVNYDFDQSNVLVAASGALASDGDFQFTSDPITSDGERIYLEYGQIRAKSGWYHFDASVEITWSGTPANRETAVVVTGPYEAERVMFDLSYAHKECLTIAGDVDIGTDGTPITFAIQGMPTGMTATVVNASVHALVAGSAGGGTGPSYQPGTGIVIEGDTISVDQSTVAMQSDLPDMSGYQEKLTTGDGISIDGNNEISVKTDGTTITVNADGELVATGGTGPSYQAGTGISIEGDTISVDQSTVAMKTDLPDMSGYQEKLTTGDGISIGQNNEISVKTDGTTITVNPNGELVATGGSFTQVQADYAQTNDQAVDFIKNKPDLSVFARSADLAPVATSGDFNDLTNKPSIPAAQVNSDWNASSGVAEILNKPQNLVQDASYVHTDNNFTTTLKDKLDGIESGAEANVQANWNESDSSSDAYIKNKPQNLVQDASYVHTDNNFTTSLKDKLDGIESGAEANVQADWSQSDSTADDFIKNKPQNLVQDASYVHTDNNFTTTLKDKLDGIEAGAEANVQADWNQSDSAADDFIKHKPTIRNVPAVTSADNGKVLKAIYSDLVIGYRWESDTSDVPAYTTSDDGKVLGVVDNQGTASLEWVTPAAGTVTDVEVNGSSVVSGGVASITIPAQVQSDWLESDSTDPAYIVNKPSIPVVPPTKDLVAGTGINIVQGANDVTISATDGVPAVTSSDDAKVLTATYSGGTGSFAWQSLPAAPTLSSLNTAGITDLQVVQSLPASTTPTVLYLIPET